MSKRGRFLFLLVFFGGCPSLRAVPLRYGFAVRSYLRAYGTSVRRASRVALRIASPCVAHKRNAFAIAFREAHSSGRAVFFS
jgi:hypothetical protein